MASRLGSGHGLERAKHLQLLVSHGIVVETRRGLHGDQAQQLEQVVLHHVPEGADAIVIVDPVADAQILGHGDLHMVDDFPAPQGFKEGVSEAQR